MKFGDNVFDNSQREDAEKEKLSCKYWIILKIL